VQFALAAQHAFGRVDLELELRGRCRGNARCLHQACHEPRHVDWRQRRFL
jgi:hypothetical protein